MATMKRRVLYFSDEEWEEARQHAERLGLTISAYVRSAVIGGQVVPPAVDRELRRALDAIGEPPFSTRPFTPVPKPGKRKP